MFGRSTRLRLLRPILTASVLGASIAGALFALPWIGFVITPAVLRKATIAFLIGLEIAYAIGMAALLAGAMICGALFWRARRSGKKGYAAARGALGWPSGARAPRIDVAACAGHFELQASDWKLIANRGYMFQWGTVSLRHDRRQRESTMQAFADAAKRLAAGESPEAVGLPNLGVPTGLGH
jgi:hypothetical protein